MRTLNPNTLERVENYITEYQKKHGKSPSYRQIIVGMLRKLWAKVKNFVKWLLKTLGDKTNIIIFVIVLLVVSCEVWIPYLIAIITGNEWWWAVGSACWAFWLAPFTPFIPLCIALTAAVRKIYDKIKKKKDGD